MASRLATSAAWASAPGGLPDWFCAHDRATAQAMAARTASARTTFLCIPTPSDREDDERQDYIRGSHCRGLIDAMNPQTYQLIDGQVLHAARPQIRDVFGRYSMNAHGDKLLRLRMLVAETLNLFDEFGRDAVDAEGNQFLEVDTAIAFLSERLDPFRRCAMDAHCDQGVFVRVIAGPLQKAHHLGRHAVNAKGHQLVAVGDVQTGVA